MSGQTEQLTSKLVAEGRRRKAQKKSRDVDSSKSLSDKKESKESVKKYNEQYSPILKISHACSL